MQLVLLFLIVLGLLTGYAAGRLHQWYRHALERDEAWRDGYDQGTGTLFQLATRALRRKPGETSTEIAVAPTEKVTEGTVTAITDAPSAGRHSFEIRHATTRRLPGPDQQAI